MKDLIVKKTGPKFQSSTLSTRTSRQIMVTYGSVVSNNDNGTCNVELYSGFTVKQLRLRSGTFSKTDPVAGSIAYPEVGSDVMILHPKGDLLAGWVEPSILDHRSNKVKDELLGDGDKAVLPGGWTIKYNQETGQYEVVNASFSLILDPDTSEVTITDFSGNSWTFDDAGIVIKDRHGHEIKQEFGGITLKTGDASIWLPNILPNCLFTGAPHGGPTAGITKLKGE